MGTRTRPLRNGCIVYEKLTKYHCWLILSLQRRDQAGSIPTFPADFFHLAVKLIDQRGDRKLGAVAPRLVEADG